ncbi:hypothetical protein DICSQDRAFT_136037 [Dichomitus squalens LYAD-421 SS1]|uniref:Uncharacterized protein n=1 Tax=Dichomitus squalens (strain LYAD-421) TaxID=732165 RepID=R7T1S3_DICSQ|nr:uncharacterized protein DICSQDRAFT_136037 [Dichomitus squalens LYAD-421 SS1]EJF61910.1 hypothetical protein DICSQDRAFT_136037 [Dichomitus squalens LYAD-421 SS1]
MDIVVRMQRYEQDQWDLRRQLTNLQTYVDDLKHEIRRIKSSDNSDDVRANLTYLLMESVKPIDSLKPEEEEPGEDHVRHREDFPNIKFFTARDWTEYKRDNKKSTRDGEPVIRGKAKSSLGENHTALYLERTDGQPADGDYVNDARKFARTLINLALTSKYKMPRKWSEADIWFQELFYTALRKRFPLFQLCHNNAKGNFSMTQAYYEAVTRKWENIRPQNLDLENSKYTIKSHSASGEDDDETVDVRDTTKASKPTTKRPPTTVITPPRPAKAARTQGQDAEPELSRQTPGKGKGRAGPSLLAIMATSAYDMSSYTMFAATHVPCPTQNRRPARTARAKYHVGPRLGSRGSRNVHCGYGGP